MCEAHQTIIIMTKQMHLESSEEILSQAIKIEGFMEQHQQHT